MANFNPSLFSRRKLKRVRPESDSSPLGRLPAMSLQDFQPPVSGTDSLGCFAMKPVTVVVAVPDPITSEALSTSLRSHFRVVLPVAGLEQVRSSVLKHRADVVVLDLESTPVHEITSLLREFSSVSVV